MYVMAKQLGIKSNMCNKLKLFSTVQQVRCFTMQSTVLSIRILIFCMLFWKLSNSAELDSIPAVLLKPIMLFNRTLIAPLLSRPDYVCGQDRLTPQEKEKLCELVFNQKELKSRYKVQYDDKFEKSGFNYNCHLKVFNCWLNNIFNLGMNQEMFLCPVINSESGNRVEKYYISTNYTPDKVIVFEAGDDGRVFAIVGVYDLNLDKIHAETSQSNTART